MHQNILMVFCRRTMHYSLKQVAARLDMPVSLYRELECGEVLLNYEQAQKLAKLYNSETKYFYEAAQQLDLLESSRIMIKTLMAENERLRAHLGRLNDELP